MPWARVFLLVAIILGGAAVWMGRVADPTPETVAAPHDGALAPTFRLTDLDGQPHALSDYRGQAVVINFWASWCRPCRAEMPALQRVYEDYQDEGLVVLAVNVAQDPAQVAAFVEELGLDFPILLDGNAAVSHLYEQQAFPTTYFVDAQGRVQATAFGGPMTEAFIESNVRRILP